MVVSVKMKNSLVCTIVVLAALIASPVSRSQAAQFDPHDLSGVWQLAPGGGGQGPGDNFPPLAAWGQARYDANKPGYGPKAAPGGNDPILKCDPMGFPRIMFAIWPFEIIPIRGRILMFFEGHHTIREIWMDGRKLPDDPDPRWYGYSAGRWDGDTLVVETNNFNGRTRLDTNGHPHSDALVLTERWTRPNLGTIDYVMQIHDPKTYTEDWKNVRQFQLRTDQEIMEYSCEENNKSLWEGRIKPPKYEDQ